MAKQKKTADEIANCAKILESTKESVDSLYAIYTKEKGTKKGPANDQQQDILRAILLLACAGFDSFLKQLIQDTLESVRAKSKASRHFFVQKTASLLRPKEQKEINVELVASALMSGDPQDYFFQLVRRQLADGSLQKYSELQTVMDAFGINRDTFSAKKSDIHRLFHARNLVAHEFDYDFAVKAVGVKNRTQRRKEEIEAYTKLAIELMDAIYSMVNETLLAP